MTNEELGFVKELRDHGYSWVEITKRFNYEFGMRKKKETLRTAFRRSFHYTPQGKRLEAPKVLIMDVETAPIIGYVWKMYDNNLSPNMIKQDWHLLSWAAKWLGDPPEKTMYMDQRKAKNIEDDKRILKGMWKLMDEADILITQNGVSFDTKKLNARFILNGMQPPSHYRNIDTLKIARRNFKFTSNKLEYMTDQLCTKYKKLKHSKYSGFELWKECLAGNAEAWDEMEKYNKYDVLSLEELYQKLIPWDGSIDFNVYNDSEDYVCKCGSTEFKKRGFFYTNTGKFQQYSCKSCGHLSRSSENLLSKSKRKSLRRKV